MAEVLCRQKQIALGLPYPKSSCQKCGTLLRIDWRCPEEEAEPAALPQPAQKPGGAPCGECHLRAGEKCDVCGAVAPGRQAVVEEADIEALMLARAACDVGLARGIFALPERVRAARDRLDNLVRRLLVGADHG